MVAGEGMGLDRGGSEHRGAHQGGERSATLTPIEAAVPPYSRASAAVGIRGMILSAF
jgi:hypothetical protein